MAKAMKYSVVERALTAQRCVLLRVNGSHFIWSCPCGLHRASIAPQKGIVSPGVVRDTIKQLGCLEKGWLQ